MAALQNNIIILFFASALTAFCWTFFRGKQWTELSAKTLPSSLKMLAAILLPLLAIFAAGQLAGLNIGSGALYCAPAVIVPFVLARVKFLPWQRSLLLLIISVAATYIIPANDATALESILVGLLTWKLADNLLNAEQATLEDVLPSLIWFTTVYWSHFGGANVKEPIQQGLVLGTLATSIFIRWVQTPLLGEDKVYLKRVVLSIFGGLAVLCIITKVVEAHAFPKLALMAGSGYLLAYLFQSTDNLKDSPTIRGLKQLLYIGILTLVASRIFGTLGTLVLSSTMLVATTSSTARIAAIFWVARALMQGFVTQYNPNVTGVNLTHPYTSAALYAGFIAAVIFSLFMRDMAEKRFLAIVIIGCAIAMPAASNYFIHVEPTSSLLIAMSVASVLVCTLAPAFYEKSVDGSESIILIPALMAASGLLGSELLELGTNSTHQDRLIGVGVLAFVVVLVGLVNHFVLSGPKGRPAPPTEVSADAT